MRIVCGIDDSDGALRALRVAADLARRLGAHLVVATVAAPVPHIPPEMRTPDGAPDREELMADRRERAGAVLARIARDAGVAGDAELKVLAGDPAHVLMAEARADEGPALIVVGSRGRGAIRAAILGSVSAQLVGESPCPVVVVPPDRAPPGTEGRGAAGGGAPRRP